MRERQSRWLSVRETATELDSTGAEICRLLNLGRLSGVKEKHPGLPGGEQWLVDPRSITREKRYRAKRASEQQRSKSAGTGASTQVDEASRGPSE